LSEVNNLRFRNFFRKNSRKFILRISCQVSTPIE